MGRPKDGDDSERTYGEGKEEIRKDKEKDLGKRNIKSSPFYQVIKLVEVWFFTGWDREGGWW